MIFWPRRKSVISDLEQVLSKNKQVLKMKSTKRLEVVLDEAISWIEHIINGVQDKFLNVR